MRKKALFFSVLAALMLAGCSNDDVSEVIQDETPKVFTGDEAYIAVRLCDAGSTMSRATTKDPGYEYGSEDEHSVQNAYFYFYDANGVFVSEGSAWNDGTPSSDSPVGNIEFKSNNVVVLKGLTKKNYPKYMVTVLNRPSDFEYGTTLDQMEKTLSGGIKDSKEKFVMSTTSWAGQKDAQGKGMKYFVTETQESNFSLEPIDHAANSDNYVTVYVERLAAKVTLSVSSDLALTEIDGKKYYEITATVAGEDNNNNDDKATENLYVELLGWKLNATAKNSYMVKNLNENWTDTELGFAWNKRTDFRSFWGKSFNYGQSGYPANASEASDCKYLDYFNLNDNLVDLGKSAYCAENTNTSDIVSGNFPSAVTSILVKAKVCDEKGNALDLVRFNGMLFKQSSFLEYVLNVMNAKGLLNVWVEITPEGSNDKKYKQIGTDNVELTDAGDGKVIVVLKEGVKLYERSGQEGSYTYTEMTNFSTVENNLKKESGDAIGYNGGLMYYNIPIEHLNETNKTNGVYDGIKEGNYGVVRNHHYYVTINKLEKIGKGIYNPNEAIVPGGDDDDKDTYYVGATIHILSWKIVIQNVEL